MASATLPWRPSPSSLAERLAAVLPRDRRFHVYHVSTPPTRTPALCSAPPNEHPDRTYCEKHLLTVSIDVPDGRRHCDRREDATPTAAPAADAGDSSEAEPAVGEVLVLALEVFVYTTAYSSIFFVSKADSTGYLHLLGLPKGSPSPIRD